MMKSSTNQMKDFNYKRFQKTRNECYGQDV